MSLCAGALQFPVTGAQGPELVPTWWCPCAQSELVCWGWHEDLEGPAQTQTSTPLTTLPDLAQKLLWLKWPGDEPVFIWSNLWPYSVCTDGILMKSYGLLWSLYVISYMAHEGNSYSIGSLVPVCTSWSFRTGADWILASSSGRSLWALHSTNNCQQRCLKGKDYITSVGLDVSVTGVQTSALLQVLLHQALDMASPDPWPKPSRKSGIGKEFFQKLLYPRLFKVPIVPMPRNTHVVPLLLLYNACLGDLLAVEFSLQLESCVEQGSLRVFKGCKENTVINLAFVGHRVLQLGWWGSQGVTYHKILPKAK